MPRLGHSSLKNVCPANDVAQYLSLGFEVEFANGFPLAAAIGKRIFGESNDVVKVAPDPRKNVLLCKQPQGRCRGCVEINVEQDGAEGSIWVRLPFRHGFGDIAEDNIGAA